MLYHNNQLCISGSELIISPENPAGVISKALWDKWRRLEIVKVVRRACYGQPALIEFNSLPSEYRDKIAVSLGVPPAEEAHTRGLKDRMESDPRAVSYFSNYKLADGRMLPDKAQREYSINAAILNTIKTAHTETTNSRRAMGAKGPSKFWENTLIAVNNIRTETGHSLPSRLVPLKRKFQAYVNEGYQSLISGKYCNDNSRKVTDQLERLILSIYAMPNKPFANQVHVLYTQFIMGKIQVVDAKTGELFDPANFVRNGEPIHISEATVWNYLNAPENRMIVDKSRMGAHRYNTTHRPHHHRRAPQFSFSKISMDDRDLPRKCVNGKYVKAYYSYDVASGCVIGYAHSQHKDEALFIDCMRDMFRLIERESFGMPLEVEVENHLVNKFFDDLAMMFPFVRICNPGNSQEKHAEHFNRQKKYGVEKNSQNGIGRWWSKHEAYQVDRDKVNDEFVEKTYSYERLVADDIAAVIEYNNQLHPKQKKYPGKTRWDVLKENMNPNVPQVSKPAIYKAIGERTQTSIRRTSYATVRDQKFAIDDLNVLNKLLPHNYSVDAYFMPDVDGFFTEVFLYQRQNGLDVFIGRATKLIEYNTARAEQTPEDLAAYQEQAKMVAKFDKAAKEGKNDLAKIEITNTEVIENAIAQPVEIVNTPQQESIDDIIDDDDIDYAARAIDNL